MGLKLENEIYEHGEDTEKVIFNNLDENVRIEKNYKFFDQKTSNKTPYNIQYTLQTNMILKKLLLFVGILCVILLLISITFLIIFITNGKQNEDLQIERCPGVDWIEYKDSKCFKLVKSFVKYSEAHSICNKDSTGKYKAQPAMINSLDEQEFLNNYLYNKSELKTSVWIGMLKVKDEFLWVDGSKPSFINWAIGYPSNLSDNHCVKLGRKHSKFNNGQWIDISCSEGHYLLCEKLQVWSIYEAEMALIKAKYETQHQMNQLKEQLEGKIFPIEKSDRLTSLEREINEIKANPVPIGFVYVQLKDQPLPSETWPSVTWTEISAFYPGFFFRVVGGNASSFGQIQESKSQHLEAIRSTSEIPVRFLDSNEEFHSIIIRPGEWSELFLAGTINSTYGSTTKAMKVLVSDTETRPVNTAMRIWKRVV